MCWVTRYCVIVFLFSLFYSTWFRKSVIHQYCVSCLYTTRVFDSLAFPHFSSEPSRLGHHHFRETSPEDSVSLSGVNQFPRGLGWSCKWTKAWRFGPILSIAIYIFGLVVLFVDILPDKIISTQTKKTTLSDKISIQGPTSISEDKRLFQKTNIYLKYLYLSNT